MRKYTKKMKIMSKKKNTNNNRVTRRIIGIEILRMFLCFRIVLLHYYSLNNKYILKLKNNNYQVPCFFFISFYFLYSTISNINIDKMKLRLERLLIPYIIYPIIVWIVNNLMFKIIKFNRFNRLLSIKELIIHLIIGKGIFGIGVLWFHFNLLILTLLFFISSYFIKNYFLFIFQIIALFSYIMQYSNTNFNFFNNYKLIIWMSVGNLVETFPIAITSFSLASTNFLQWISANKIKYIFLSSFFLYLIFEYNIFSPLKGYSSRGIKQIIISFFLFTMFFISPFEKLNSKVLVAFSIITKFTQGIYCLHFLIQYYIKLKFDEKGTFLGCIFLYIISYTFSFLGYKIFAKTKLKYLFN